MGSTLLKLGIITLVVSAITIGCKKPYLPPATTTNFNYLVVEGIINTGADSTIIKLSRTITIGNDSTGVVHELNAAITVESDQNKSYTLKELGRGTYALPGLKLDIARQYRLRIKTTDNKEYLSDFVPAKISPPIDSVTYQYTGGTEGIYSYTHDATNNTRYYRWEYTETYLYYSPIQSNFIFNGHSIVQTTPATQISTCYISDTSSHVILNSTAKLTQDIVQKNPITTIPFSLDKLKLRYTILVKQYAITPDAYNFYAALAKNTENLGSIFDAQPSALKSNIHCTTNAAEPVIGYISAGTVTKQRIFIDRADLPVSLIGVDYSYCGTAVLSYDRKQIDPYPSIFTTGLEVPTDSVQRSYNPKLNDTSYTFTYSDRNCVDCTLKGSNKKPSFWKDRQ